ncbi:hypothetical protein ACFULT_26615 [Rhodococcus sp. NPDC057297]|uniref:hypothetical protein n=1 Tax=Rhodococcus sp. NPDC057297 TaxID=3346090 RepID=UPI00362F9B97
MSKLSDLLNSQPVTARQAAEVADKRGISLPYGTIAAYWSGRHGRPSARTLERLAEVLTIPLAQLQKAAWNKTAPAEDWTPPPEVRLLNDRQRRALDELIRSFAATQREDDEQVTQQGTQEGSTEHIGAGGTARDSGAPIAADPSEFRKAAAELGKRISNVVRDGETADEMMQDARELHHGDKDDALISPSQVTQADLALARREGLTEDEIREKFGIPYD